MLFAKRYYKFQSFLENLIGNADKYHLEARVYHGICILSLLVLVLNSIMNFLLGMPVLSLLMLPAIALLCYLFYLSRYRFMLNLSVTSFCILGYVVFIANFYYNSGIDGPTLMIFMVYLFITISIVPKRQYLFWMFFNVIVVVTLLAFQYYYGGLIRNTYPEKITRYIDSIYAYTTIAPLIFLVTIYIRKSYNHERQQSDQKSEQLEQANESKNKLLSILAHDLRSPLSSIQSFLEVMSDFNLAPEEELVIKKALLNETKNAHQMLTNLLSWSKAQMDGVKVQLVAVNLREVLKVTLALQHTVAAEKLIGFRNEIREDLNIVADPDMLDLVVRNLVNNAIKFTQEGGEVVIYTEMHENECFVVVADNGKGIAYDKQADIFNFKTQSTFGTKNEKGVGLGLVLCKEFVSFQNGRIWFESTPEKGTRFYISLPLSKSLSLMEDLEISNGR